DELLRKTNENVQILEKQRNLFDKHLQKLTYYELRNQPSLTQAIKTMQKGLFIQKISEDLKRDIVELGREGSLLKTRIREISYGVDKEVDLIIKDYTKVDVRKSRGVLDALSYEEILHDEEILR